MENNEAKLQNVSKVLKRVSISYGVKRKERKKLLKIVKEEYHLNSIKEITSELIEIEKRLAEYQKKFNICYDILEDELK